MEVLLNSAFMLFKLRLTGVLVWVIEGGHYAEKSASEHYESLLNCTGVLLSQSPSGNLVAMRSDQSELGHSF